jgi:hypothetical protein
MRQHVSAADRMIALLASARDQLAAAASAFWQRRAALDEIDRLGPQEARCLARDLGIPAADVRILAGKDSHAADLLYRRMETLGLDPARIDTAVMRDLQRCCSKCLDKGLCVHELEDRPREPTWPKYCPNEQTLTALTEQQSLRDGPPGEDPTLRS